MQVEIDALTARIILGALDVAEQESVTGLRYPEEWTDAHQNASDRLIATLSEIAASEQAGEQ